MRWIVELCHNPLIQTLSFLIERLDFVTLTSRHTVYRGWGRYWFRLAQSKLVNNLSGMSQLRRKDQSVLAPPQRAIENVEFLLSWGFCSNHLITSSPSFLERRPHLRCTLARTSDKDVITLHCPDSLRKQQRDTVPTVRQQLTSPFLNSSLHGASTVMADFGQTDFGQLWPELVF